MAAVGAPAYDQPVKLTNFLRQRFQDILEDASAGLARANLSGYTHDGIETARERLNVLLGIVIDGVERRDLGRMLRHAEIVARERFEHGYDISEVQTAFNVLEEALWKHVMRALSLSDQGEALALISTVLGEGKDALARTYVALAARAGTHSLNLESMSTSM